MYIYVLYVCALEEEMAALQEEFLHHQQKVEEFENLKSEHNQKFVGKWKRQIATFFHAYLQEIFYIYIRTCNTFTLYLYYILIHIILHNVRYIHQQILDLMNQFKT